MITVNRLLTIIPILISSFAMVYSQNMGINLTAGSTPNVTLDVNGSMAIREGTTLTLVNGVNSDIALGSYTLFRVTGPTATFSVTGFTGGVDGRVLILINATSYTMSLNHQITSTSANQINTGGTNISLAANGVATLIYNSTLTKWVVTGTSGSSPVFNTITTGTYSDSMLVINNGVPGRVPPREYIETYAWGLDGNAGTVDGTHFLGTVDNIPFNIRVNNQKAGRIDHLLNNSFWGYQAGNAVTTGSYNTAMGQSALAALTQGTANIGVGTSALAALTTGSDNVAVGSSTLATMTTGNSNVAIGNQSGLSNTTGIRNVSIGYQSARNGTHSNSIMIGYQAGMQNAASNNVFIGSLSGPLTNTGSDNIGMGYYTLFNNTTGKNNIGIGSFALSTTSAAWGNTAIGHMSSASIQTGQANTAVGDSSLMNNVLGNNNTHIGYRAGLWTTGSNNIAIGANAVLPVTTADNQLAIGTWLYGTNSNLGINTTTPQYKLDIDARTGSAGNPLRLQGLSAGATSDSVLTSSSGIVRRLSIAQVLGNAWNISGNAGTTAGTNFVGTTDAQPLVFKTNGTEGMRLNTSQNLGLGTTSPSYKLDVVGRSRFQTGGGSAGFWLTNNANSADRAFYGMYDDNTAGIYSNANSAWGFTYKLTNGNIGLNVISPEANLHLYGSGTSGFTPTGTSVMVNPGAGPELAFSRGGAYKPQATIQLIDYNGYSGGLAFNVHKGTANSAGGTFADNWPTEVNQAMTIVNNGNIGIGTSDPVYRLHVEEPGGYNGDIGVRLYNNNTASYFPSLILQASRGTKTTPSAVTSGTVLGVVRYGGYDGTAFSDIYAAEIKGLATENWTTSAHGTELTFGTIANGSTSISDRMVIDQNGYVGVGTSSPVGLLHVSSDGTGLGNDIVMSGYHASDAPAFNHRRARGTEVAPTNLSNSDVLGGYHWYGYVNSSWNFLSAINATYKGNGTTVSSTLDFFTSNTQRMVLDESGNIGLGMASPSVKLHQDNGTATTNYHKFTAGTTTGQTSSDGFDVGVDASGNAVLNQQEAAAMILSTSNAERMRILSGGNVGIGLNAPSVKLHQDNGNATATYHKFTAGTTTGQTSSDGFDVGVDASGNAVLNQKEALPLIMSANNAEVMRVTSAGNVLIGGNLTPGEVTGVALVNQSASDQKDDITITTYNTTTTPAFVLFKARGTPSVPATLTNSEDLGGFNVNGYASTGFRGLTSVATITASDYTTSFGADIAFKTSRNNVSSERMRIMSTGNVGIGVTAPSHILQINGQGRATSSTWATTSDRRLKDIDGKLEYGLNELMKINTYRFHYKKDNPLNLSSDKPFQGTIAQELQKVIPEAVQDNPDGYFTVNNDPVFWTMLNSIKELKKEKDDLQVEVEQLRKELAQQNKITEGVLQRLEKLEASLNQSTSTSKISSPTEPQGKKTTQSERK